MPDWVSFLIPIAGAHVAALVIAVVVIKRLLFNDTMEAIKRIKEVEEEVKKKEENVKKRIEEQEKEFEKLRAKLEEELAIKREETISAINAERENIILNAKAEADRIIENAKRTEVEFRTKIIQEVQEKAISFASEITRLALTEKMNDILDGQLIDELLDALEQMDTESIIVEGNNVEFITSRLLSDTRRARIEKLLSDKFGINVKIEEKIDPDLIAGMMCKLGSLEIDGSFITRLKEAMEEVKKTFSF